MIAEPGPKVSFVQGFYCKVVECNILWFFFAAPDLHSSILQDIIDTYGEEGISLPSGVRHMSLIPAPFPFPVPKPPPPTAAEAERGGEEESECSEEEEPDVGVAEPERGVAEEAEKGMTEDPERGVAEELEGGVADEPEKGVAEGTEMGVTEEPEVGVADEISEEGVVETGAKLGEEHGSEEGESEKDSMKEPESGVARIGDRGVAMGLLGGPGLPRGGVALGGVSRSPERAVALMRVGGSRAMSLGGKGLEITQSTPQFVKKEEGEGEPPLKEFVTSNFKDIMNEVLSRF